MTDTQAIILIAALFKTRDYILDAIEERVGFNEMPDAAFLQAALNFWIECHQALKDKEH